MHTQKKPPPPLITEDEACFHRDLYSGWKTGLPDSHRDKLLDLFPY